METVPTAAGSSEQRVLLELITEFEEILARNRQLLHDYADCPEDAIKRRGMCQAYQYTIHHLQTKAGIPTPFGCKM